MNVLESLEKKYNVKLPQAYKAWFYKGGPKTEGFLGTDMDMPYLPNLQDWAGELLEESKADYVLPSESFVFAMHQGYQFMFFLCNGNDDPEIWYYMEGDLKPEIKWESFTKFISDDQLKHS